jgi:hypothetical protein
VLVANQRVSMRDNLLVDPGSFVTKASFCLFDQEVEVQGDQGDEE